MIKRKLSTIIIVMILSMLFIGIIVGSGTADDTDPIISYDRESVIAVGDNNEAFTVKEKKYGYNGGGVMILNVENNTDKAYNVIITGHMLAENGVEISTVRKEFTGFPAESRNYFIFRTYVMFDKFEYSFNAAEYEGETHADCIKLTSDASVELEPWTHDMQGKPYDEHMTIMNIKYPFTSECKEELSFSYCADFVLFDNTGEIYLINSMVRDTFSLPQNSKSYLSHMEILPRACPWGTYKIPRELKGRLKGIVAFRSIEPYTPIQQ